MTLALDRRTILKGAAYAAPLFAAGKLYAAPASGPRVLVVFLRGAYDAANIVVPVSSDFYYASRPNIAIAKDAVLPLDSDWGLHPALKDSILPLWQAKEIAFIPTGASQPDAKEPKGIPSNVDFGIGKDSKTLYITVDTSLFRIPCKIDGYHIPFKK